MRTVRVSVEADGHGGVGVVVEAEGEAHVVAVLVHEVDERRVAAPGGGGGVGKAEDAIDLELEGLQKGKSEGKGGRAERTGSKLEVECSMEPMRVVEVSPVERKAKESWRTKPED